MTKKKKTGHIKQTKHKKPAGRGRQTSQRKPVNQGKQTNQRKPASQKKASEQVKPASQKKASEQAKLTAQEKSPDRIRREDQTKQTGRQTNRSSKIKQDKQPGNAQQENSSVRQRDNNTQRRKNHTDQGQNSIRHRGQWKEVLYNCPYVLGIVFTSLLVMLWSDEIGFKAVAREAQAVMAQAGRVGERIKNPLLNANKTLSDEAFGADDKRAEVVENISKNDKQQNGNAGICKEDIDDKEKEKELNINSISPNNAENKGNTEEVPRGVTSFTIYDPQEIDSRYYSDAGKIALTTEYPYTKENIGYFSDAAFLGDSRTLGISDYAGLEEADFYCDSGMMIFKLLEEEITYQKTGDKVDLTQVLQEKQYGKIYIMLGMNELGYGNTETYLEQYRKVVDQIREWQPQAIIYIMANLHVSREKNNMETEFNNININDKNAASAQLANGTDIFYLDANPLFTDEDGFLNAELTFDGVHLYAQHYDVWREFLLEHAVEPVECQQQVE